jgi:hypothetical protein
MQFCTLSSWKTQSVSREWSILFSKICNCVWALISSWTSVNIIIPLKQTLRLRCRCRHTGWALHNSSSFLYMKPFLYSFQSWIDVHHWIFCYYSVFVQQFNSSFFLTTTNILKNQLSVFLCNTIRFALPHSVSICFLPLSQLISTHSYPPYFHHPFLS